MGAVSTPEKVKFDVDGQIQSTARNEIVQKILIKRVYVYVYVC